MTDGRPTEYSQWGARTSLSPLPMTAEIFENRARLAWNCMSASSAKQTLARPGLNDWSP